MKFDRNIKRSLKTLVLATTIIWGSLFSSKALADENFGKEKNESYIMEVIRGGERTSEKIYDIPKGTIEIIRGDKKTRETIYALEENEMLVMNGEEKKFYGIDENGKAKKKEMKFGERKEAREYFAQNNFSYNKVKVLEGKCTEQSLSANEFVERKSNSNLELYLAGVLIPLAIAGSITKKKNSQREFLTQEEEIKSYLDSYRIGNYGEIKSPVSLYTDRYNNVRYRNAKTGRFVKKETALELLSSNVRAAA